MIKNCIRLKMQHSDSKDVCELPGKYKVGQILQTKTNLMAGMAVAGQAVMTPRVK